ncbi:MAG: type IV pilin protein [Sulfuricellaceae bacterium]
MKKHVGFTLVELMVVVSIVGILSAVGIPSYIDYLVRSRIPDATSNLAAKRVQMEQFYQDNRTYAGANAICPDTAVSQYFDFACTGASATAYTLTATGKGSMAGFVYTIDQSNAKATTAVPSGWTTNATCWVTAKGGTC